MSRLFGVAAALGLLAATSAVAGIPSEIEIDSGRIAGTTGATPDIRVFKGIPFAAPPVGGNRWRPPRNGPAFDAPASTRRVARRAGPAARTRRRPARTACT
jgi:para-nitrobenzyl esterase